MAVVHLFLATSFEVIDDELPLDENNIRRRRDSLSGPDVFALLLKGDLVWVSSVTSEAWKSLAKEDEYAVRWSMQSIPTSFSPSVASSVDDLSVFSTRLILNPRSNLRSRVLSFRLATVIKEERERERITRESEVDIDNHGMKEKKMRKNNVMIIPNSNINRWDIWRKSVKNSRHMSKHLTREKHHESNLYVLPETVNVLRKTRKFLTLACDRQ